MGSSIFLIGCGGHAKVILDLLEKQRTWQVAFLLDDNPALSGTTLFSYPVSGTRDDLPRILSSMAGKASLSSTDGARARNRPDGESFSGLSSTDGARARNRPDGESFSGLSALVSIGDNQARCRCADWLQERDIPRITAIHPSAQVSRGALIGAGTVLMANTVVNADTHLAEDVIINTSASVDHDCVVGRGTHIAPGVHVCGGVTIGRGCMIGVGANILPGISIGHQVIIGAGATVTRNVPDGTTVLGTPARPFSSPKTRKIDL